MNTSDTNWNLVFLIYRSRSGSTFFADRLGRHPDVLVTPESKIGRRLYDFFNKRKDQSVQNVIEYIYKEKKFRDWGLPRQNLVGELDNQDLNWHSVFLSVCDAYKKWKKPNAKIVVFKKSGWYARKIEMLFHVFADSTAISVVRDPRAVYNSARKALHSETNEPMAENILKNALGWKRFILKSKAAQKKYPDRVLFVKYESMLDDLEEVLSTTWDFLNTRELNKNEMEELLSSDKDSHLITNSTEHLHENVQKDPIKSFADKWKNELPVWKSWLIEIICRKEMALFNYQ